MRQPRRTGVLVRTLPPRGDASGQRREMLWRQQPEGDHLLQRGVVLGEPRPAGRMLRAEGAGGRVRQVDPAKALHRDRPDDGQVPPRRPGDGRDLRRRDRPRHLLQRPARDRPGECCGAVQLRGQALPCDDLRHAHAGRAQHLMHAHLAVPPLARLLAQPHVEGLPGVWLSPGHVHPPDGGRGAARCRRQRDGRARQPAGEQGADRPVGREDRRSGNGSTSRWDAHPGRQRRATPVEGHRTVVRCVPWYR